MLAWRRSYDEILLNLEDLNDIYFCLRWEILFVSVVEVL